MGLSLSQQIIVVALRQWEAPDEQIAWPEGKTCAVWVAPNLEYYEIDPPANPQRKAWAKPHPDVVGYSYRDHSNRVSHWRMADVMSRHGFPGSVSLSVALCQHHPEVVQDGVERGWEFFSHGIYNTRYSYGMDEAQERAIIEDSIRTVKEASGQRIRGYLAPALTHTPRTLDLLAEHGIEFCCDWVNDELPYRFNNGVIDLPLNTELSDRMIVETQQHSAEAWGEMMRDACDWLAGEASAQDSARLLPIQLTPYIMGQPYRIEALEALLAEFAARNDVWFATGSAIVDSWAAQQ
mgnify:CR=1 FL=1